MLILLKMLYVIHIYTYTRKNIHPYIHAYYFTYIYIGIVYSKSKLIWCNKEHVIFIRIEQWDKY